MRRHFLSMCVAGWLFLAGATPHAADAYPTKPVRLVLGSAAGSTPDAMARLIAHKLSERWRVPVVVDNRAGAAGLLAADTVAKSPADGYTLLLGDTATWAINPQLYRKLPYDPVGDFVPVSQLASLPMLLVVNSQLPVKTVQELVAYLKKSPATADYASAGNGSIHHITAELFKSLAGLSAKHVPYKGSAPAALGLMSGEIAFGFMGYANVTQAVASGRVRMLAAATLRRVEAFPDLPTLAESGFPGFDMFGSSGVLAPAGTPPKTIAAIQSALAAAVADKEVVAALQKLGVVAQASTPREFGEFIQRDQKKYERLVKLSGAGVD